MSLDVDGDSGDSDSAICDSRFAQAEARKKSKATSTVPLALGSVLIVGQLCIASNSNLNGRKSFLDH